MSDQQGKLKELKAEHQGLKYHKPSWSTAAGQFLNLLLFAFLLSHRSKAAFLQSKSREEPGRKDGKKPCRKDEADYRGETFRKD